MEPAVAAFDRYAELLPNAAQPDLAARVRKLLEALRTLSAQSKDADPALVPLAFEHLAALPAEQPCAETVDCLLEIGRYWFAQGRADLALDPATKASALADALHDNDRLAAALNVVGTVTSMTSNYPAALGALNRALHAADSGGYAVRRLNAVLSLGVAHTHAGCYAEAQACFDQVLTATESAAGLQRQREAALGNLAYVCLLLRDLGHGIDAAERALAGIADPRSEVECVARIGIERNYVLLLIEAKQYGPALRRAKIARNIAERFGSHYASMLSRATEALAEIAAQSTDVGLTRLQQAVDDARQSSPSILHDLLGTAVRGYALAKHPDVARLMFDELLKLNKETYTDRLRLHQQRHLRDLDATMRARQAQIEADQQRELDEQMDSVELTQAQSAFLEKAAQAAELHDDETAYHVFRVGSMVREIARARGLDERTCLLLEIGARQHDIGKIVIPESILTKPGRFTPMEREIMETHAAEGARLIREAGGGLPQMKIAEEIAHAHHERWDGTGYPRKLKGAMIPLAARIAAIADVFDALTHRRSYKDAWSIEDAMAEIERCGGTHFDPELTAIFMKLVPRLRTEHGDLEAFLCAPGNNNQFIRDRAELNQQLRNDRDTFESRR